jgi:hypothetical protein
MDEAKVQSDAEILFMGSMGNGEADRAKNKPRPNQSSMKTARTRSYYKLSVLKTEHQLHLGGGGGLLAGFLGLGLGGGGGLVLGESKAGGAEEERKAEHRGHDLFHWVFLLDKSTTLGRLAELSCQLDMKAPLKRD